MAIQCAIACLAGLMAAPMMAAPMMAAPSITAPPITAPLAVPSPLYQQGRRWIGKALACTDLPGWDAEPLFSQRFPPFTPPPSTSDLCVYTWRRSPQPPFEVDIQNLISGSGASPLLQDVPVVVPMQAAEWSSAENNFFSALRQSFLQQVGTVALLPAMPSKPVARIVVIDSAPTAIHGAIQQGAGSRHGDTLAHLIEDVVCEPLSGGARRCAAEVTSELALPWINSSTSSLQGGHTGSPVDLSRAILNATQRWESDVRFQRDSTPPRLILNLSVGWEHTADVADCPTIPVASTKLPAFAVQSALQYAASKGAIIIAAAGNDAGGPSQRLALTCPGNYQSMPLSASPNQQLLTAVSGVDYADRPLEMSRPSGHTGIVALGFAGVAWGSAEAAPPSLVGSSVAAAAVSAISGLVLAKRPELTTAEVIGAIYNGGSPPNTSPSTTPDSCPFSIPGCVTKRASACGALIAAGGAAPLCSQPPDAKPWSSPSLPAEVAALHASVNPTMRNAAFTPLYKNPRLLRPSTQVDPWTFPMPISATCPTCVVSAAAGFLAVPAQLNIPALGRPLQIPMLLLRLEDNSQLGIKLEGPLLEGVPYRFDLPPLPPVRAAYLSGFDWQEQHSITEQLFVHR